MNLNMFVLFCTSPPMIFKEIVIFENAFLELVACAGTAYLSLWRLRVINMQCLCKT